MTLRPEPMDPVPEVGQGFWMELPSKPGKPRPAVCVHASSSGLLLVVYGTKTARPHLDPIIVLPATPLAKGLDLTETTHFYPADLTNPPTLATTMWLNGTGYRIHRLGQQVHAELGKRLRARCGIAG